MTHHLLRLLVISWLSITPAAISQTTLAPEKQVASYKVKPPASFTQEAASQQGNRIMRFWKNPSGTGLFAVTVEPNAAANGKNNKTMYQGTIMGMSVSMRISSPEALKSESITLNGMTFEHGRWSDSSPSALFKYGCVYTQTSNGEIVVITGFGKDPSVFKQAEAAAVTLRK